VFVPSFFFFFSPIFSFLFVCVCINSLTLSLHLALLCCQHGILIYLLLLLSHYWFEWTCQPVSFFTQFLLWFPAAWTHVMETNWVDSSFILCLVYATNWQWDCICHNSEGCSLLPIMSRGCMQLKSQYIIVHQIHYFIVGLRWNVLSYPAKGIKNVDPVLSSQKIVQ
jgi:hypothetical protein